MRIERWTLLTLTAVTMVACGTTAKLPESAGRGPNPILPEPQREIIPTIEIAPAKGWGSGAKPVAAAGMNVAAFADGLDHPRWLHVLPNGDVLVAESNAPERPEQGKGIRGYFQKEAMKKAGAVTKTANRITLLRDADGDGTAETKSVFLTGLNSPFGMAHANGKVFIANTDAVVSVPYTVRATEITTTPAEVTVLPAGPRNHHWTKGLIASPDGSKLYATVGSNSNIAENGLDE